jgi:hypothetical protein
VGDEEEILADLERLRERSGASYIVVFEEDMEAFAPVVQRAVETA